MVVVNAVKSAVRIGARIADSDARLRFTNYLIEQVNISTWLDPWQALIITFHIHRWLNVFLFRIASFMGLNHGLHRYLYLLLKNSYVLLWWMLHTNSRKTVGLTRRMSQERGPYQNHWLNLLEMFWHAIHAISYLTRVEQKMTKTTLRIQILWLALQRWMVQEQLSFCWRTSHSFSQSNTWENTTQSCRMVP